MRSDTRHAQKRNEGRVRRVASRWEWMRGNRSEGTNFERDVTAARGTLANLIAEASRLLESVLVFSTMLPQHVNRNTSFICWGVFLFRGLSVRRRKSTARQNQAEKT